MTHFIDVSRTIESAAAMYPGDDPIQLPPVCQIGSEAPCNITALQGWTTHFLTHMDAPRHFIADGATLDTYPLDRFYVDTVVVNVSGDAVVPSDVPANVSAKGVLFKTRNSGSDPDVFHEDHVYITKEAAELLVERGVSLVGVDGLSVDKFGDEDYPAHNTLLGADVLIIEGLELSEAESGAYKLIAAPLKIKEADGSPLRAVLAR
ncbi:cyclase family protein [Streptomyces sp. FL07-04A]|uniref:cyclase family protein n=1 Tax=Streptomyces sp. FL07-04A TaxID=3028658 RepID=UPI0029B4ED23|nr:cyclase family protein [Streptomyces sp. FL07-04A]MDX3579192.1 cyclase family protein [Streptomyces sp. FL07-04A]